MHKARAFFYVCAGICLLALSYHLGARNATAQAPGNPIVALAATGSTSYMAMTPSGDAYFSGDVGATWTLRGNTFGGPTPAQRESFGALKSRYRATPGAAQPTQDR